MSGDHPNTPLRSQPVDVVAWLRCEADAAAREPAPWKMLARAADEIERLREEVRRLRAVMPTHISRILYEGEG